MTTDTALLQAFRSGDESAFATLAERYHQAIRAACQRQAPVGEVDDCVQAVFLVLARRPSAAARAPVLLAWLHQVTVYVCHNARRASTRRRKLVNRVPPNPAPGNTPDNEVLERLDAALLDLEERQRAAVLLHACGNATSDIAESLGVTTANASKLVQRGLATLRERLGRTGVTVGASMLLAVMTSQSATAAATPPLTIHVLNHASTNASLLAKGTTMHMTLTSASTWILAAGLAAVLGVGALIASDAFTPTPPRPHAQALVEPPKVPVPVPVPVLNDWEKTMEQQLKKQFTFDFQEAQSVDVFDFLRKITETTIIIHPDINVNSFITFKAKEMSLRAALNHISRMTQTQYRLVDQAIFFFPADLNQGQLDHIEKTLSNAVGVDGETPWGKQILKSLNKEVTFDFQNTPLKEAIDMLQSLSGINFVIDPETGLSSKWLTLQVESMKLRHVLNHIMRMHYLSYQLRDEAILITSLPELSSDVPEASPVPPATDSGIRSVP